jgi:hypothetical protein
MTTTMDRRSEMIAQGVGFLASYTASYTTKALLNNVLPTAGPLPIRVLLWTGKFVIATTVGVKSAKTMRAETRGIIRELRAI